MAEELQGLLKRIKEEGISQVETHKTELLAEAKREAAKIVQTARQEAEKLVTDAKKDVEQAHIRGEEALRQASRDLMLSVKDALRTELEKTVRLEIQQAMTPDMMSGIIDKMVAMFSEMKGRVDGIDVLLSPDDLEKLEKLVAQRFSGRLKNGVTLKPSPAIEAGIQIGANGGNMFIDFTDDALTDMLCRYLNPRIAKLVKESAGT